MGGHSCVQCVEEGRCGRTQFCTVFGGGEVWEDIAGSNVEVCDGLLGFNSK